MVAIGHAGIPLRKGSINTTGRHTSLSYCGFVLSNMRDLIIAGCNKVHYVVCASSLRPQTLTEVAFHGSFQALIQGAEEEETSRRPLQRHGKLISVPEEITNTPGTMTVLYQANSYK